MGRQGHSTQSVRRYLRTHRQWAAWVAVCALLIQLVVPFGQALAFDPEQDIEYQFICTANGIKQIPINTDGSPVDPPANASCPFCFLTAAPALFSPAYDCAVVSEDLRIPVSFTQLNEQIPANIWRGAPRPSRAPPLSI